MFLTLNAFRFSSTASQDNMAAWQAYYQQYYQQMQQMAQQQQQLPVSSAAAAGAAGAAVAATATANPAQPATGTPAATAAASADGTADYSEQWAAYYRYIYSVKIIHSVNSPRKFERSPRAVLVCLALIDRSNPANLLDLPVSRYYGMEKEAEMYEQMAKQKKAAQQAATNSTTCMFYNYPYHNIPYPPQR